MGEPAHETGIANSGGRGALAAAWLGGATGRGVPEGGLPSLGFLPILPAHMPKGSLTLSAASPVGSVRGVSAAALVAVCNPWL